MTFALSGLARLAARGPAVDERDRPLGERRVITLRSQDFPPVVVRGLKRRDFDEGKAARNQIPPRLEGGVAVARRRKQGFTAKAKAQELFEKRDLVGHDHGVFVPISLDLRQKGDERRDPLGFGDKEIALEMAPDLEALGQADEASVRSADLLDERRKPLPVQRADDAVVDEGEALGPRSTVTP